MVTFVLLHGSFHAAWNWHKLIPLLHQRGHTPVALDLPAHGRDHTPAHQVTLASCVERVLEVVDSTPGEIVLVAHSRNGIVISQAAEQRPDRLHGLVYLAAYLVPNGKSMMDYAVLDTPSLVAQNVPLPLTRRQVAALLPLARNGAIRWLLARLLPARWQTHALEPSAYKDALYHDCPEEVAELANVLLEPEPNWPGFTPLRLTRERYGRVPRVYVLCTADRAVTPPLQQRMLQESGCHRVFSLDTGHSPFFSRPRDLAEILVESLQTFAAAHGPRSSPPPEAARRLPAVPEAAV